MTKPRHQPKFPPSLSPAAKSVTMTSEFKYLHAFGDEGLDHPQFALFSFEPEFPGNTSDQFLESSKILAADVPLNTDDVMSPLSMLDQVSDSFGLHETQFPFNLSSQAPIAQSSSSAFDSFDLAPSSPMQSRLSLDQYPDSPFHPFSVGLSCESSVDHSDSESDSAVHGQAGDASQMVTADRSYFKVDLEFPWQVYIRDPERLEKVTAWKQKKVRVLEHKIKKNTYQVRTDVANRRMRVKGRFVGKCIS